MTGSGAGPADHLVLKLVLTPALVAAATLVGRRWGPAVSGVVAGLPLTSVPVSVFLALEQGPAFAARAARGTLLGLLSQAALCVVYSRVARRRGWAPSTAAGVAAFLATTAILARLAPPLLPALALVGAALPAAAAAIPVGAGPGRPPRPPAWDLPARMGVAALVVLALTAAATGLGPGLTGLLSPFPVFALVLGGFAHRAAGAPAAARLLRGLVGGSAAHAAAFALLAVLLPDAPLAPAYGLAGLAALGVSALALSLSAPRRARPA